MQGYDGKAALFLSFVLWSALAERLFFEARPKERPNESVPIPIALYRRQKFVSDVLESELCAPVPLH